MKKRMQETSKGRLFYDEADEMGWASTQAVNSAALQKTCDPYSGLLVEERHPVRYGEALALQDAQAGIDGVRVRDTKKEGLLLHLLEILKEDGLNTFSRPLFPKTHGKLPELLSYQVKIFVVKYGFEMDGFVPTMA